MTQETKLAVCFESGALWFTEPFRDALRLALFHSRAKGSKGLTLLVKPMIRKRVGDETLCRIRDGEIL